MHNAKVPHDDRCRDRIGELMAEDDDQRQVERVSGTVHPEVVKSRVRGAREDRWFEWVDHRVQEPELDQVQEQTKRTQTIVKRNVSDSQRAEARIGKAKTWKNWQRGRKNSILVPMLRCRSTQDMENRRRCRDAADAAPEQMNMLLDAREQSMNSFVQSKTEVFEKFEESLRPLCMAEDLNDDEIMELRVLSKELNACETTNTQSVEVCVMCNEVGTP